MFSPRGMLNYVTARTWLRALVIVAGALLLYQEPAVFWIAAGLLVYVIAGELFRYGRSWQEHNELLSKHGEVYERVLATQRAEHSLDTLIGSSWVYVSVAVEKSLKVNRSER